MKASRALEWEHPILAPSLDRVIAGFPLPVLIHDDQDRITQMSEGWTRFSGYTLADVNTMDRWTEAAYGERRKWVKAYIDSHFAENRTIDHGEWVIRAKDGTGRVWHFRSTPLGEVHGRRLVLAVAS